MGVLLVAIWLRHDPAVILLNVNLAHVTKQSLHLGERSDRLLNATATSPRALEIIICQL